MQDEEKIGSVLKNGDIFIFTWLSNVGFLFLCQKTLWRGNILWKVEADKVQN